MCYVLAYLRYIRSTLKLSLKKTQKKLTFIRTVIFAILYFLQKYTAVTRFKLTSIHKWFKLVFYKFCPHQVSHIYSSCQFFVNLKKINLSSTLLPYSTDDMWNKIYHVKKWQKSSEKKKKKKKTFNKCFFVLRINTGSSLTVYKIFLKRNSPIFLPPSWKNYPTRQNTIVNLIIYFSAKIPSMQYINQHNYSGSISLWRLFSRVYLQ